jgi:hypothetical protein
MRYAFGVHHDLGPRVFGIYAHADAKTKVWKIDSAGDLLVTCACEECSKDREDGFLMRSRYRRANALPQRRKK